MKKISPILSLALLSLSMAEGKKDPPQTLTLEAAVALAKEYNPDLLALQSDLDAAGTSRRQERMPGNPGLDANIRFGEGETRAEYAVSEDISGLLLYPLRWKQAGSLYSRRHSQRHHSSLDPGKGREGVPPQPRNHQARSGSRHDHQRLGI
jgi:hypothetical protein